jgi:exonuclease SbcC
MNHVQSTSPEFDLASDSVRALEMQELREEEKYIQALKIQMEKFEAFRIEIGKKDQKIDELQKVVKDLMNSASKVKSLESENAFLASSLETKEKENFELRQKVRKQVEEYENSLKDVQTIVLKEREEKNLEIKSLRRKIAEKDEKNLSSKIAELEKQLENEIKGFKEKEKNYLEILKNSKNLEKVLKDQVAELSNEKSQIQNRVQELIDENSEIYIKFEEITKQNEKLVRNVGNIDKISDVLREFKKAKDDLVAADFKQKELLSVTGKYKSENLELQKELENLHEELEKAIEIVKRQEQSIIELRSKNQEFDLMIEDLQDENNELKRLVQSLKSSVVDKNETYEALLRKFQGQEKKMTQMEAFIKTCIEKENHDKLEREKKAKKKIELFTQRTAEVNKLAEVLESFTLDTNYLFD